MSKCENLPADLRENSRFCLWRYEERDGRQAKVPYDPLNGEKARANDPNTFSDFATAERVLERRPERFRGLGIGLFGDLVGVDIDNCVDGTGELSPLARDVVELLDSYAERSPSGSGLHVLCRAPGFTFDPARYYTKNSGLGLEVYVAGQTSRYLTVTGDVVRDAPIRTCPEALQELLERYMRRGEKAEGSGEILVNYKELARAAGSDIHTGNTWSDTPVDNTAGAAQEREEAALLDDAEVLDRMLRSAKGADIAQLWGGEWEELGFSSQSEADMALCNYLAFFTNRDAAQMDRLFRQSGLMRDKWDRPQSGSTYGALTVERAIRDCKTTWNPQFRSGHGLTDGVARAVEFLRGVDAAHNSRYRQDDVGSGYLLADYLRPYCRPVPESGGWRVYDGKRWQTDIGGVAVAEAAKDVSRALLVYAASVEGDETRERLTDWGKRWAQLNKRLVYIREAASVHPISMSAFDKDPWLLNVENGILDLRSMTLRPHDPENLVTHLAPVVYDPAARCERWESFIREIMAPGIGEATPERALAAEAKSDFLQRYLGYCLSGDTSAESLLILYGPTSRNGKSVCVEVVRSVLGDYARTAQAETIASSGQRDGRGPSEDIARLAGARMVSIAEIPEDMRLNSSVVKQLTGRDVVTARYLNQNSFEFYPQFKLLLHTNFLPACSDMSVFDSGRVLVIPFERHFAPEEQDRHLKDELRTPENRSGVLNWLLDGLRAYRERGLTPPQPVRDAVEAYRADSDTVSIFIEERLEKDPSGEEISSTVYAVFQEWCQENGRKPLGKQKFNRALERNGIRAERGYSKASRNAATLIRGYRLNWIA